MSLTQYIMSMFRSNYAAINEYTYDIDNYRVIVEPELCDIEKGLSCC
jgi:hypothetical protein